MLKEAELLIGRRATDFQRKKDVVKITVLVVTHRCKGSHICAVETKFVKDGVDW